MYSAYGLMLCCRCAAPAAAAAARYSFIQGRVTVQSWPFPDLIYYGFNREDLVTATILPPGVEAFVLGPSSVWYGRVRLLFSISVKTDSVNDPVEMKCAFISVCEEIKLDPSCMK